MPLQLNQLTRGKFYRVVAPPLRVGCIAFQTDSGPVLIHSVWGGAPHLADLDGGFVTNDRFEFEPVNFQFDGLEMPPPQPERRVTLADFHAARDGAGPMVYYKARPGWAGAQAWTHVVHPTLGISTFNTEWYSFTFDPEAE